MIIPERPCAIIHHHASFVKRVPTKPVSLWYLGNFQNLNLTKERGYQQNALDVLLCEQRSIILQNTERSIICAADAL